MTIQNLIVMLAFILFFVGFYVKVYYPTANIQSLFEQNELGILVKPGLEFQG